MSNVGKTTIEIIADSKKAKQAFFDLQKVMDKGTADFGRRLKRNNPFKVLGVLPTKRGKHTLSKFRHKESRFFLR
ncbi:TPA: hypothetical protein ACOQ5G_004530 [Bacillus cereus]